MNTTEQKLTTRQILAGAYRGKRANLTVLLTHTYDEVSGETLCRKVDGDNIVDEFGHTAEELADKPTCKCCLRRDPRFAK
ncbi:hypothetical protein [Caudoviricetes sp.]|nr:hypothetical protein [Caudoviricetes sp.]